MALPAFPVKAATPAVAPVIYEQTFLWAGFLSRIYNGASEKMLKNHFRLSDSDATAMMQKLYQANIINAPDAAGKATAVQPYLRKFLDQNAQAAFQHIGDEPTKTKRVTDKLREFASDSEDVKEIAPELTDDDQPDHPIDSTPEDSRRTD